MTATTGASATGRAGHAPSWVAVAAWGFGLVAVALGAAGVVGVQADELSRALGVMSVAVGAGALVWGAATLLRERMPLPRAAVGGVFAGIGVAIALLATAPGRAAVLAVALLLGLGVAAACGVVHGIRRPARRSSLWSLPGAAVLVTVVVVPALGACEGAALLKTDGTVAPVVGHDGH